MSNNIRYVERVFYLAKLLSDYANIDIKFPPEYIIFGTDHDFATAEIILSIKSIIYTYMQIGKFISFEGTKHNLFFKYIQTL